MTKKKKSHANLGSKAERKSESADSVPASPSGHRQQSPPPPKQTKAQGSSSSKGPKAKPPESSTSALIICRNKHWRYISSFHGPWLQLPPEILESLAHGNYASPRPQPIDPAVFFDLVKIRRLIEEATNLAVRASNGTTSSALFNSLNATNGLLGGGGSAVLGLGIGGYGGGGNAKLSRERRHRMREHASQKLSHAYRLDEIAASVATMQSASALEEVAKLVLQRSEDDCDAKYVHFFHEKIPSRSLAQCTSLEPLDEIIANRPREGSTYRTRAVTRVLKEDYAGAVRDLTEGLGMCRLYSAQHREDKKEVELASEVNNRGKSGHSMGHRYSTTTKLEEKDQPSSLEPQLLFHRGGAYLSIACQHINAALDALEIFQKEQQLLSTDTITDNSNSSTLSSTGKQAYRRWLETRKIVKTNARRALKDYMTFLSHFGYTPGLSADVTEDLVRNINLSTNGHKTRAADLDSNYSHGMGVNGNQEIPPVKVYQLSTLFSAQPPSDLPPYPEESETLAKKEQSKWKKSFIGALSSCQEVVTYHPLLTDVLHSLLLCHALVQTPEKELLRHAHMVARIARVCDGYPILLAPRSPARADWMEVLHHTDNWIQLKQSWETLCAPAPLPGHPSFAKKDMAEKEAREQSTQGIILDSLGDERVNDEETFRSVVQAREKRLEEQGKGSSPNMNSSHHSPQTGAVFKRWAQDEGKEYPICTERADMVAWWIRTAPVSTGVGRSKGKKSTRASQQPPSQPATALCKDGIINDCKQPEENVICNENQNI